MPRNNIFPFPRFNSATITQAGTRLVDRNPPVTYDRAVRTNLYTKPLTRSAAPCTTASYNATTVDVLANGEPGNGYRTKSTLTSNATGGGYCTDALSPVVIPGNTYTASANLITLPAGRTVMVQIYWRDASNATIGGAVTVVSTTTGRKYVTGTAPALATHALVAVYIATGLTGEFVEYDGIMFEMRGGTNTASTSPFFCGTSDGASWTGTAYASTSTQIVPGATSRINYSKNPVLGTNATGWSSYGARATCSRVSKPGFSSGFAWQSICPGTVVEEGGLHDYSSGLYDPSLASKTWTSSQYFIAPAGTRMQMLFQEYNMAGGFVGAAVSTATATGSLQRISATLAFSANAGYAYSSVLTSSTPPAQAVTFWQGDAMMEQTNTPGTFFPTPAQLTDQTVGWRGAAHASSSQLGWSSSGPDRCARAFYIGGQGGSNSYYFRLDPYANPGSYLSTTLTVWTDDPASVGRGIIVYLLAMDSGSSLISPNTYVTHTLSTTPTKLNISRVLPALTAKSDGFQLRCVNGGSTIETHILVDNIRVSEENDAALPFLDGSSPGWEWTGTADASVSQPRAVPDARTASMSVTSTLDTDITLGARDNDLAVGARDNGLTVTPVSTDLEVRTS